MRTPRTAGVALLAALCCMLALAAAGTVDDRPTNHTATSSVGGGLAGRFGAGGSLDGLVHRTHGTPFTMTPSVLKDDRPNIVVIMADDMRTDELRYMPHVQHLLADQGATFRNGLSPYPLCCPARASFLSGEYAQNHHVWSNKVPFGFAAFHDKETLPVWLNRAGYQTSFIGKYLNGYGWMLGKHGKNTTRYVPPGWTDWRGSIDGGLPGEPADGGTYRYMDTTLNDNGTFVANGGKYATRMVERQSSEMITRMARSDRPFFYYGSYIAPHVGTPHEPDDPTARTLPNGKVSRIHTPARPPAVRGMFDSQITAPPGPVGEKDVSDKPYYIRHMPQPDTRMVHDITTMARQRAEALHVLDEQVARTMRLLDRLGVLDNTYVVFTSDNGYFMGEHRKPQGKTITYDPALSVPVIIRGPGIPHGVVRQDPYLSIDMAPTFLQIAGARRESQIDGQSMLGTARHGDRGWDRGVVTEAGPRWEVFDPDTDLTHAHEVGPPSSLRSSEGIRTGRYLYVQHFRGDPSELYDLKRDPFEFDSVIDDPRYAHVRRELARVLHRLRDCHGVDCTRPLPRDLRTRPSSHLPQFYLLPRPSHE